MIQKCTENINETKPVENDHEKKYSSCTVYIVLFSVIFVIDIGIGIYFIYSRWYLKKYSISVDFNTHKGTLIYWTYKWEKLNN